MAFDLFVALLALALGAWGAWRGVARQVYGLGAALAALLLAHPVGDPQAGQLVRLLDLRSYLGPVVGALLAFVALYLLLRAATWVWLYSQGEEPGEREGRARALGFALGALQGLVVATALFSLAAPAEYELTLLGRRVHSAPEDSWVMTQVRALSGGGSAHAAFGAGAPIAPQPRVAAPQGGDAQDVAGPAPSTVPLQRARAVQGVIDRAGR